MFFHVLTREMAFPSLYKETFPGREGGGLLNPTPKRFALSAPILTFSSGRYVPREGFTLEDILVTQMGIFSKRGVWLLPECYRNVISLFIGTFSQSPSIYPNVAYRLI